MAHRVSLGQFGTFALGPPVRIGRTKRPRGLGRVDEFGPARGVTLFVGRNKGKQPQNRSGTCKLAPKKFSVEDVDAEFLAHRGTQIGRKKVGATRRTAHGIYEGAGEDTVTYEVAFIPSSTEPTFAAFKKHVDALAEQLAETFCQDSVLVIHDDGRSARWLRRSGTTTTPDRTGGAVPSRSSRSPDRGILRSSRTGLLTPQERPR